MAPAPLPPPPVRSRAATPPRKVTLVTTMAHFAGPLPARLAQVTALVQAAGEQAAGKLDLVVLPEAALAAGDHGPIAARVVALAEVLPPLATLARRWGTYLLAPTLLREGTQCSNAALLLDRHGELAGVYRKVHPVMGPDGTLEGGIAPGRDYPVFTCDFGRLGVQICWDMSYAEGWQALAAQAAEIVAVPSASPQTIRPAAYALAGGYFVVTSTPRDNATLFSPIGLPLAQLTAGQVLVHTVDLSYAILHWSPTLAGGRILTQQYGERVGGVYSEREDTGVFWSNDPQVPIGQMVQALGLQEMAVQVARSWHAAHGTA